MKIDYVIAIIMIPIIMIVMGLMADNIMCDGLSSGVILEECEKLKFHVTYSMIIGGFGLLAFFIVMIIRDQNKHSQPSVQESKE